MKMIPLNKDMHASMKISPVKDLKYAKTAHFARVVLPEFVRAASTCPVVFVENKETEEFQPGVMLGLQPGRNLFVSEAGDWGVPFVPATIRQYPFAHTVMDDQPDKWVLLFDEDSGLINEEEGDPLFDENGEQTETLQTIMTFMAELQGAEIATREFCSFLKEKALISPLNLQVPRGESMQAFNDVYGVNEQRLNDLSDASFLELRKRGYLTLIYAHLFSLGQIDRLVALEAMAGGGAEAFQQTPTQ